MARAGASLASWLNLTAIGEIAVQTRDIFIIDLDDMIDTERANLAPAWSSASTSTEATAATEPRPITTISITVAKS